MAALLCSQKRFWVSVGLLCALALSLAVTSEEARADSVALISYDPLCSCESGALADLRSALIGAGASLTNFVVNANVASAPTATQLSAFDQVWVYDLSLGNNLGGGYDAIAQAVNTWFRQKFSDIEDWNLILDGRIASSFSDHPTHGEPAALGYPAGHGAEEVQLIQNYYAAFAGRGGGLFLGTDDEHHGFVEGINSINNLLGIGHFSGHIEGQNLALADHTSPLMANSACHHVQGDGSCYVWDNTSTAIVPTGYQASGVYLSPVAYHGLSAAFDMAAISATFGSDTFVNPTHTVPAPLSLVLLLAAVPIILRRGQA